MEYSKMVADSGVFIDFFRKSDKRNSILYRLPNGIQLFISAVTFYELRFGATDTSKLLTLNRLLEPVSFLPFSKEVALEAAKIQLLLKKQNKMVEIRDLFIAATAITADLPLLTLNSNHFERIPQLKLLDLSSILS